MIARFVRALLRHRALALAALVATLAVSVYGASKIRLRFSYRDFYAYPGNAQLATFEEYTKEFGDPGGNVVVILKSDDVFRRPYLEYVRQLSDDLAPNELFSRIRSLSTVRIPRADGDSVETGPVMDGVPDTPEAIQSLRRVALHSRLLSRRLVSEDGTVTAVLAEMRVPTANATVEQESAAIDAVQAAIAARPPPAGLDAMITGGPSVEVAATKALLRDQMVLTPIVLTLIGIALVLAFRSPLGVLLSMGAMSVSTLCTAGVFGFIGRPVDILGSTIPTTILVYGVVDPVFLLTRYFQKWNRAASREDAIVETLSEMAMPCFLTSLTTALGFAAFVTATMPTVQYVGLIVAIGVAFSFMTTITVLPLLLSLVPVREQPRLARAHHGILDRWLTQSWRALRRHYGVALAAGLLLLVTSALAARGIRVKNEYVNSVPDGPDRNALRFLEDKLSGVNRFVVYLEGPAGSMKQPDVLQAIAGVDAEMERDPLVDSSTSLPDLIAETNEAFNGGDPSAHVVPTSASLIAQYLAVIDPNDRSDFVDEPFSHTHIRILATDRGSLEAARVREALQKAVDQAHFERFDVRARLTGNGVVTYKELDKIVVQILWGFVTAFAIVILMELVMFRSIRVAVASIIPNLLPVGACFITMRLLGLDFRLDSSLVLCVSIGALFNTTIHIVARIRHEIRGGATQPDDIIERSLRSVGPASLFTAVILSAGFSVMLLSSFPGLKALGILSMVTMISAFFSDAVFTTILMRILYAWPTLEEKSAIAAVPAGGAE